MVSRFSYCLAFGNLGIRFDGLHIGFRIGVVVGQMLPYFGDTGSTGIQQALEGGAPLVLTRRSAHRGVHRGGLLRAAPGDQVLGQEVGGNRLIRQVFDGPATISAGQQTGQLVAGDRITRIAYTGLPKQILCLQLPSLVHQEPSELVADHGIIIRQATNRLPVDGLGDVGVAETGQGAAAQIPGMAIFRRPTEGIARPGEGMVRRPGQHRLAQVAGGTDEEIIIAGGLGMVFVSVQHALDLR